MDFWKSIQIILISLAGGIVRYLVEMLEQSEENMEDLSVKLLVAHAVVGTFAGFLSYLIASLFTSSFVAGVIAAGLGSFGSYGTLFWLLEQAKKKLVVMDERVYDRYKQLREKGEFDESLEDTRDSK